VVQDKEKQYGCWYSREKIGCYCYAFSYDIMVSSWRFQTRFDGVHSILPCAFVAYYHMGSTRTCVGDGGVKARCWDTNTMNKVQWSTSSSNKEANHFKEDTVVRK
jgi:hypothetical protein